MSIRDLIVIVVSVEFGLHYFPWRMLPMLRGKELPRLAAYVLGCMSTASAKTQVNAAISKLLEK